MEDEKEKVGTENQEAQKESAGCIGIGLSFLFPIIGIILYFAKKSEKFDARGYLYAAIAGLVIGFILRIAAGAIQ